MERERERALIWVEMEMCKERWNERKIEYGSLKRKGKAELCLVSGFNANSCICSGVVFVIVLIFVRCIFYYRHEFSIFLKRNRFCWLWNVDEKKEIEACVRATGLDNFLDRFVRILWNTCFRLLYIKIISGCIFWFWFFEIARIELVWLPWNWSKRINFLISINVELTQILSRKNLKHWPEPTIRKLYVELNFNRKSDGFADIRF